VPNSYLLHACHQNAFQAAASREPKSEFQHSLQGIYTRTARIIYPVDYVKTYS